MDECKPIKTSMPSNGHLNLDEEGKMVDHTLYRSMIGSVGFINPGSLGDRLSRQGSAQENDFSFFWTGPRV